MRSSRLHPLLLGAVAGVVYALTCAPGLFYTDTGELAAASATLGVAHPTGYPLFTMLSHVWTLLPWPSVIGGLTMLNILFVAAGTTVLVMLCCACNAWCLSYAVLPLAPWGMCPTHLTAGQAPHRIAGASPRSLLLSRHMFCFVLLC